MTSGKVGLSITTMLGQREKWENREGLNTVSPFSSLRPAVHCAISSSHYLACSPSFPLCKVQKCTKGGILSDLTICVYMIDQNCATDVFSQMQSKNLKGSGKKVLLPSMNMMEQSPSKNMMKQSIFKHYDEKTAQLVKHTWN